MTHRPVGSGVSFSTSTTTAKSSAFIAKSQALRLFATDSNAFVAIGTEPTATVNDYAVPAGTTATIAINNGSARVVDVTLEQLLSFTSLKVKHLHLLLGIMFL